LLAWPGILNGLNDAIEDSQEQNDVDDDEDNDNEQHIAEMERKQELALVAISTACSLAQSWLSVTPDRTEANASKKKKETETTALSRKCPEELMEVAQTLHDMLFDLVEHPKLQAQVCRLCQAIWFREDQGRENLVTHLLPVMMIRTLEQQTSKDVDIKKLFRCREMLELLDLSDESADSLKQLLLRCFIAPQFLRLSEGRRFLVHVMGLEHEFLDDIHSTILAQICFVRGRKPVS
jgi:hypothetical protein